MNKKEILFRVYQVVLLVLYIGLMVFFIVKCLENGVESTESSQVVVDATAGAINSVNPSKPADPTNPDFQLMVRKLFGHFGFFCLLGLVSSLLYLSIKKIKSYYLVAIHYVAGIAFAVISEFLLEGNTEGRVGSWGDVGIDSAGFILLSTVVVIIYYIKTRKLSNNT